MLPSIKRFAEARQVEIAVAERIGYRILFREFLIKGLPLMIIKTRVAYGEFYPREMFFP